MDQGSGPGENLDTQDLPSSTPDDGLQERLTRFADEWLKEGEDLTDGLEVFLELLNEEAEGYEGYKGIKLAKDSSTELANEPAAALVSRNDGPEASDPATTVVDEPAEAPAEAPAEEAPVEAPADKAAADKAAADKAAADKAATDKAAADKAAADKAAADKAAADKVAADKAAADKAAADKAAADKAAADKAATDKAAADKAAADKAAADKAAAEKESADKAATVNNLIQEFMASDKAMVGFLRSIDQRVSRGELTPEVALLVKQEINGRVGDFVSNLSEQITNGSLTVDQARQYVQSLNNPILRDRANELLRRIDRKNISIDGANIEEMLESLMNTPDFQNAPPAVQQLLRNQAESMAAENATRRQHSQELGEIATAMRTLEGPAGDMRERFEGQFYRGRLAMPALIFILVTAGAFLIPGMNAVIGPIMLVNLLGTGGMALRNIFRNGGLDEYLRQRMDQALARYRTIEQIEGDADTQHTTAEARDREILNQLIRQTTLLLASGTPGDPAQREAVANFLANSLGVNVILPTGSR